MKKIAKVNIYYRIYILVPSLSNLYLQNTIELGKPGILFLPAMSLLFRMNFSPLEHFSIPFELRGVAQQLYRYPTCPVSAPRWLGRSESGRLVRPPVGSRRG